MKRAMIVALLALTMASGLVALTGAQQPSQDAAVRVAIDADDIGGVVRSAAGPEAGVWVIAETADFQTKFRRIVVTDDQGRYVIPDLPAATYRVWVRGYGLVDSPAVQAAPGQQLALAALVAPDARAAAQYYPASHWMSLMQIPPPDAFPMEILAAPNQARGGAPAAAGGRGGRGGPAGPQVIQSQEQWVNAIKGCIVCHQIGNQATREISPSLGTFDSSIAAWERRLRSGQIGANMFAAVSRLGSREKGLAFYADWTDRIAAGETPQAPPRPQGVERNIVLSSWDVSNATAFIHDVVSANKWGATANPYGPVYAADFHNDALIVLDPLKNTHEMLPIPTKVPKNQIPTFTGQRIDLPSPVWGEQIVIEDHVAPDTPMLDHEGRVWVTGMMRGPENPSYCYDGTKNTFAKQFAITQNRRQTAVYDPKTRTWRSVDTCFMTHHVTSGAPGDPRMYYNGLGTTLGWIDTKVYFETGDEERAQGWCAAYVDINADGRIDIDVDKPIQPIGIYSLSVSPADGSIWAGSPSGTPGRIVRYTLGRNPPETCIAEVYEPPYNNPARPGVKGMLPRGIDVDLNGVVWASLAQSGQLASFDRRRCRGPLTGEAALGGQHCPEGWTLYPLPAPNFKGLKRSWSIARPKRSVAETGFSRSRRCRLSATVSLPTSTAAAI